MNPNTHIPRIYFRTFVILFVVAKQNKTNKTHTQEPSQVSMDNEESLGHTQAAMRLTKPKKTGKQKYNTE